jgi:hypothetical protein
MIEKASSEVERLGEVVHTNGHVYKLIQRTDYKALYEQRTKAGILAGYEVFQVIVLPAGKVFNKDYEAREKYPSASDFGITAWSTGVSIDQALKKYGSLSNNN